MGTELKVYSSGWKTIVEPYINVSGTWKTVHKVHIKDGGQWRVAHQTSSSRYTQQSAIGGGSSGNYTVPNNGTRYVKVQVVGQGGGAGGGIRSGGAGASGGHFQCSGSTWVGSTVTDYATGGTGGAGSNVIVILHVWPGNYIAWATSGNNGAGGAPGSPMELSYSASSTVAVGTQHYGSTGTSGANMQLTVYNSNGGTSISSVFANGGAGGGGGSVRVDGNCTGSGFSGYSVSSPTGSTGSNGSSTISGNIDSTIQDSYTTTNNSSAGEPGVGNSNAYGGSGRYPEVTLWPMTPNQS